MKKLIIATCLIGLAATSAKAQGFYVRGGVGYSFPNAGDTYAKTSNATSIELKKYSLGSGFGGTLAGGYWFNENVGVEVAANILFAAKKYEFTSSGATSTTNTMFYSKAPIYLMPSVVLKTNNESINIYSRVGLAINVKSKTVLEEHAVNTGGGTDDITTEYRYHTGIGFQGALGVMFPLGDVLSVFVEANGISMNQYLKKSEIVKADVDGASVLSAYTTADKITEYEYTLNSSTATGPNVPAKSFSISHPFSTFGASAGIIFKF